MALRDCDRPQPTGDTWGDIADLALRSLKSLEACNERLAKLRELDANRCKVLPEGEADDE